MMQSHTRVFIAVLSFVGGACAGNGRNAEPLASTPTSDQPTTTQSVDTPVSATSDTTSPFQNAAVALTATATGFTADEGKAVHVAVIDPNGAVVAMNPDPNQSVISGGQVTIHALGALPAGTALKLVWFVDSNGNGFCNANGLDHTGSVDLAAEGASAPVALAPDPNNPFVCDSFGKFALHFIADNFQVHAPELVYVVVSDLADKTQVSNVLHLAAGPAPLPYNWPGLLLEGHSYQVSFFADVDGNKQCDGVDHQYDTMLPPVAADVTAHGSHGIDIKPVCTSFPTGNLQQ